MQVQTVLQVNRFLTHLRKDDLGKPQSVLQTFHEPALLRKDAPAAQKL